MPSDPSSIAGLVGWWKADALTLADGDPVSSWTDSSGNGFDATQATPANQPVFNTGQLNGLPAVNFNGSSDSLAAAITSTAQPFTVFAVADADSPSTSAMIL